MVMYGACCSHCGTTFMAPFWGEPFLCLRCRENIFPQAEVKPIVTFWDSEWREVPPPEWFEVSA
jgi:hypothetical protein